MKSFLKELIKKTFPILYIHYLTYSSLIKNKNSFLYSTGWMRSFKENRSVDNRGEYLPWMNFSIIQFLDDRFKKDLNLFEFGSGYSTFFYASKVKNVTSIEHMKQWFDNLEPLIPSNVNLIFQKKDFNDKYCRMINQNNKEYDVIIIDGRDRVNCFKQSMNSLSLRGVIILDDAHREKYQDIFTMSKKSGFKYLSIDGLKAAKSNIYRTTIFYKKENCLNI
tara:strand:- start:194 stop:856 length:663 start_codon:yes stop_codon:yes gene_type:complete